MVITSKIDYITLINLGFKTRKQATDIFKQFKGTNFKTEEEYLKHYWHDYKHVIYANKLEELEKISNNRKQQDYAEYESDVEKEFKKLKANINLQYRYESVEEENDELLSELIHLRQENEQLHNVVSVININNRSNDCSQYIMNLKTKKANQCYTCSICLQDIMKKEIIYDVCHMFHIRCLTLHLINNNNCPNCRNVLI